MKKCVLIVISALLAACSYFKEDATSSDVVAKVGAKTLTRSDLALIIPESTDSVDSVAMVNNLIVKWATDELLYQNAQRNVPDEEEVNRMVEEYRKAITIHQYQQMLIEQRMPQPTEEEIRQIYLAHQEEFLLSEPLVRGVMAILPENAPKVETLTSALKKLDDSSIAKIDKYCTQHAITYDYFIKKWVPYSELQKQLPLPSSDRNGYLQSHKYDMWQDSGYIYLVGISEYLLVGAEMPYEFAKDKIRQTLVNQRKLDFIREFGKELYDEALQDGKIVLYNK